jgi:hypothetical protein
MKRLLTTLRAARPAALQALAAVAAGAPSSAGDESFVVADVFATPGKLLATVALSPTPIPTATVEGQSAPIEPAATLPVPTAVVLQPTMPINTPGPTPTLAIDAPTAVTVTPTADCAPPAPFLTLWEGSEEARALLGCPTGSPQPVGGVFQTYEHGVMFWRESDKSIFVLSDASGQQSDSGGSWWRLDDTFEEGEPESDPSLVPPDGLLQPVRGFGKVWRSNGFIREATGWATAPEQAAESTWLDFEGGWMMTGPEGSMVYAMIPLDDPPHATGMVFSGN